MSSKLRGFSNETFSSLRFRNFRLFFIGQGISQVGNWLTLVTQTLLVLALTDSGVAVGLLTACQFAPILLFGAFAGPRRRPLRQAEAAHHRAVLRDGAVVRARRARAHGRPARPRDLRRRVRSVGSRWRSTTRRVVRSSSRWCRKQTSTTRSSLNSAVMTSSRIVGPALAGLLIATAGYSWAFALDGLSYIAVIVGLWMMNPAELRPAPVAERGKRHGARRPRVRAPGPRPVDPARDDGDRRDARLQLPGRAPAAREADVPRRRHDVHDAVLDHQHRFARRRAVDRATQAHHHSPHHRGEHRVRCRDAPARRHAEPRVDLPDRHGRGLGEHLASSPRRRRSCRSRPRPRCAGRVLALQAIVFLGSTPDRRPDRRLRQPGVGAARGHRARRVRVPLRGRVRLPSPPAAPTSVRRSGGSTTIRRTRRSKSPDPLRHHAVSRGPRSAGRPASSP